MKKSILKVLALSLVLVMTMSMAAFADAGLSATDKSGSTAVNITGVTAGDEVTLLVVKHGVSLENVATNGILYIDQKTSNENGAATFTYSVDTEEVDIYSGYSSMEDGDSPLKKIYSANAPKVTYVVTFNDKDGVELKKVTVDKNTSVAATDFPTAPTVEGSTFSGWFNGTTELTASTIISADLSVNATYTPAAVTIVYGDVNGDGKVDTTDASLALQYYANKITSFPATNGMASADVNGDTKIDTTDASLILQFYANKIAKFPIEK